MIFKVWDVTASPEKKIEFDNPPEKRSVLEGIDPRLKQIAFDRLAILREWQRRSMEAGKPGTKNKVTNRFLEELNSGILWPDADGVKKTISKLCRATLYGLQKAYKNGGLAALVPRYKTKESKGQAIFQPLKKPFEMKFSGPPRREGKQFFIERVKRRWKLPPLEGPIRLKIEFDMPVPKGSRMPRRMKMVKGKISHTGKPNLDVLQSFIVDCLSGIVFKHHSHIVDISSRKAYRWWPQTRILVSRGPG
ncbi:MAG: RusA family crossover junction endodeoxyribonuclease [Deltaproteobacteria bacterium]|nr:RusA family crossover junction endodeoxyribonuclease [Deltaproteobacteria bacterium]MBM4322319.1 RusA family crossover junction endodeoxyribonuclease [Deltaproteobacteria bacterium]